MKENQLMNAVNVKVPRNLFGLALLETVLVVMATMLPTFLAALFSWVTNCDFSRFVSTIRSFFSCGDGVVLALSLLGATFVNMLDVGGGKTDDWASFKKCIWMLFFALYAIALVSNCATVVSAKKNMPLSLMVLLMVFSCVILLSSNWWRRHHSDVNLENPFRAENDGFVEKFDEFLKRS